MIRRQRESWTWLGRPVSRRSLLMGSAAVVAFLAVDLGAVLAANGWLAADGRLTPRVFMDAFAYVNGRHSGFRANHAKGVAVTGYFDSNGNGASVSSAMLFAPSRRTDVQGRFSLSGGNPTVADSDTAARGLALAFDFPNGQQWRTAMLNLMVFPDNSVQGFLDRLLASKAVASTGKPDPEAMAAFLAKHPETALAMSINKRHPPTAAFADSTYRGLNTFYFVNSDGVRTPVRWQFVPVVAPAAGTRPTAGPNMLFDTLISQLKRQPLRWRLVVTLGAPSDPVTDPTVPWPPERRTIDAGMLTLTTVASDGRGNARDINFDPLVLPDGIEPSTDPVLAARSAVYAASFRSRAYGSPSAPPVGVKAVSA